MSVFRYIGRYPVCRTFMDILLELQTKYLENMEDCTAITVMVAQEDMAGIMDEFEKSTGKKHMTLQREGELLTVLCQWE